VRGCSATLLPVPYRDRNKSDRTLPWCQAHGIRLHSRTFVYWNGSKLNDEARLRISWSGLISSKTESCAGE
jgi:hypothetical protein